MSVRAGGRTRGGHARGGVDGDAGDLYWGGGAAAGQGGVSEHLVSAAGEQVYGPALPARQGSTAGAAYAAGCSGERFEPGTERNGSPMELEMNEVLGSLSVEPGTAGRSGKRARAYGGKQAGAARSGGLPATCRGLRLPLRRVAMGGDVRAGAGAQATALAEQEIADTAWRRGARARQCGGGRGVRKTLPAATVQLLAKQGIDSVDGLDMSNAGCGIDRTERLSSGWRSRRSWCERER